MTEPKKSVIEIHIKLPTWFHFAFIKKIQTKYRNLSHRKKRILKTIGIIIAVSLIALLTILIISALNPKATQSTTGTSKKIAGPVQKTPDYKTILPDGKTIEGLGGWTRVSPPESNPVFAYIDTINGKEIRVSQQPLPEELRGEDINSQIEQLATGYKATDKVTVGNVTVFIGTSAKGPQSAIFAKNNLLILIKSSVVISDDEWASYVNSLK